MRRFIAVLSVFLAVSLASCGGKNTESSSEIIPEGTTQVTAEAQTTSQTEKTEAVTSETTGSSKQESTEKGTSEASATEPASTDIPTFPDDSLHYPDGGAEFEQQLDESVLAAAQMMFDLACETEWSFTVGSPYPLDFSQYIENEFHWQYYLVTADGVNSLDDVRADYHRVFSESHTDTLDELFVEQNGRVYCLNGERGSYYFYENSVVSEITGRSDGEIRFRVVHNYSGDGPDGGPYSEEEEFVIVRESGEWRVSEFRLPY